ncbi:thermonuclease family protein [Desertibaculum subflavum]|uniref:thermonuclease family protein n=1 Tax=Desertibaculum subflavum TaxID=2268458 RepID=UPI000E66D965
MLRIIVIAAAMLFGATTASAAERITGHACVQSGNILEIPCGSATRIRLYGIDAPEPAQICTLPSGTLYDCGEIAASVLRDLIDKSQPVCQVLGQDFYQRPVAICRVGKLNLNAELVRRGWALAYRDTKAYAALEVEAKTAKRGLWAGQFDEPRKWRHATTGKEE